MRILVLSGAAAVAAVLCAGPAAAQSSAVDWSGPYVGLNGGWNQGRTQGDASAFTINPLSGAAAGVGAATVPSTTVVAGRPELSRSGFEGGAQLGFNAVAGPLVWGAEGDFDGMTNRYTTYETFSLPATALTTGSSVLAVQRTTPRWTASIRGRVGVASGPALFYVTGGPAWVRMRQTEGYSYAPAVTSAVAAANPGVAFGPYSNSVQTSDTRRGWTVGAGAELMRTANLSFGVEYRYTWADRFDAGSATSAPNTVYETGRSDFHDNAVLAKVNVKFGRPGRWF